VIHQFSNTIDKNTAIHLLKLLQKYQPETPAQKKHRRLKRAKRIAAAKTKEEKMKALAPAPRRTQTIKSGIKHVTTLVEYNRAKLVVIAHDVDPIELVMWLPTLCKKKGIPYLIIKGKARLGKLVHKKTCSTIAVTDVGPKHKKDLDNLIQKSQNLYLSKYADIMKTEGGGVMGHKHYARLAKEEKRKQKEERKKVKSS